MDGIQTAVQQIKPRFHITVSLVLLLVLFILRIPFVAGIMLFSSSTPSWALPVFENGTFLLTAALIWWERRRLSEFHIGYGALGIFILGPAVFSIALKAEDPFNGMLGTRWIQIGIGLLLLVSLFIWRPVLKKVTLKSLVWILASIFIGLAVGALYGYVNSLVMPGERVQFATIPAFIVMFIRQLTWAATLEEPLFRGFLWGFLRNAGWKDLWICFFQAGMFLLAHIYYIKVNPIIFINVFIAAFILGLVVWKSRSIANSMTVHGLFNSVGDIVSHFKF